MNRVVQKGKVYTHFKGNEYRVICIAIHTETNEQMVVYQDCQDPTKIFVRPYDMFVSQVDQKQYPDAKQVYRFEEK